MFSTRTAKCSQNTDIVDFLDRKRDEFLAEGSKYATVCDKACKSLCDHPMPIYSAAEAGKLKFVGQWITKILKPFFEERICAPAPAPMPQPSLAEPSGPKGKAARKYCPTKGSGAYAVLITLLKAHQSGKAFLKKQEIWDEVDKSGLSNTPMRPNPGFAPTNQSGYYSAWSGVNKTLINRCFVSKSSNPAKYKLTDQGFIVAQECTERAGLGPVNRLGHEAVREEELSVSPAQQENGDSGSGGQESPCSDDDIQQLRRSDLRQRNNIDFASSQSGMGVDDLHSARLKRNLAGNSSFQSVPLVTQTDSAANADNLTLTRNDDSYVHHSVSATIEVRGNATVDMGSIDSEFELQVPPLKAGEKFSDVYEVICILDTREKFRSRVGAADSYLQNFVEGLKEQFKLRVEKRQIPVGDILWIARHRQQNEEYVLDFILERKHVRDLWMSIKDNRYKQQKLRLKNCGLKCLLYLVEGDVNTDVECTESLKTAMITTQVQDEFRVLRTAHENDTLKQYGHLTLAIMSRYNVETGKGGKSGHVCKTYTAFVEHCKDQLKDRVKDVFIRQLTQISSVTEDVACSIQDRYPTLFSIAEAFTRLLEQMTGASIVSASIVCEATKDVLYTRAKYTRSVMGSEFQEGNQEAQEKLLQGLPIRSTSKTITPVMSKNIYKAIWGS